MNCGWCNFKSDDLGELITHWSVKHPYHERINSVKNFLRNNTPRRLYREIKWFVQRGRRGYADCDVWEFNDYLAKIVASGVEDLRRISHGYPCSLTAEGWDKILGEIAYGFSLYTNYEGDVDKSVRENIEDENKVQAEFKKSFTLFEKHFGSLWD